MITVKCLSCGADSFGVVSTLLYRVKSAWFTYDRSPNRETALFLDAQWRGPVISASHCPRGCKTDDEEHHERNERFPMFHSHGFISFSG
jgi:hypothetical protein